MIWCVDDDNTIRDIEVYTLTQTGFEAKGFADGISMLEALKSDKPELIVLDIMLPGMDGFAVCSKIRETSNTHILIASAKVEKNDKLKGLNLGADDYIEKPYDVDILIAKIKGIFKRKYGQEEIVEGNIRLNVSFCGERD